MLKLHFSSTEIHHLPKSNHQGSLQSFAHSKQCYCWCLLYTLSLNKGKNRLKDQTKVISDCVHHSHIVPVLAHLTMSQEWIKMSCQHPMWENISSALSFVWFPKWPDPFGQLSTINTLLLLNFYCQSIHERNLCWHLLNLLFPSRLLCPVLILSTQPDLLKVQCTRVWGFTNAALSHLILSHLG